MYLTYEHTAFEGRCLSFNFVAILPRVPISSQIGVGAQPKFAEILNE